MAAYRQRKRVEASAMSVAFNNPDKLDELYPDPQPTGTLIERWWGKDA